jgi:hypothetical protein
MLGAGAIARVELELELELELGLLPAAAGAVFCFGVHLFFCFGAILSCAVCVAEMVWRTHSSSLIINLNSHVIHFETENLCHC